MINMTSEQLQDMYFHGKFKNEGRFRISYYNARSRNIPEAMQAHGTSVARRCMLHHRAVAWVWVKLRLCAHAHPASFGEKDEKG